jgi:hypothetical protein
MVYSRINARRSSGEEDHKLVGKTLEEVDAMGDESPRFRLVPYSHPGRQNEMALTAA